MHKEAASKLIDRASNTGKPYAVFLLQSGDTKTTNTTTDLFRAAMQRQPERLVGAYDEHARPEWITDDVECCRSRMACAA